MFYNNLLYNYEAKWIIIINNLNIITMSNLITKRFVVRQSLIGKNVTFEFTNKKGDKITYNHDKVFSIMKDTLTKLPCWLK